MRPTTAAPGNPDRAAGVVIYAQISGSMMPSSAGEDLHNQPSGPGSSHMAKHVRYYLSFAWKFLAEAGISDGVAEEVSRVEFSNTLFGA